MTKSIKKAKALNAFFISGFTSLCHSSALEASGKAWGYIVSLEDDQIREHLKKMDIPKSMGLDGMHPQVLRELSVWGHSC